MGMNIKLDINGGDTISHIFVRRIDKLDIWDVGKVYEYEVYRVYPDQEQAFLGKIKHSYHNGADVLAKKAIEHVLLSERETNKAMAGIDNEHVFKEQADIKADT